VPKRVIGGGDEGALQTGRYGVASSLIWSRHHRMIGGDRRVARRATTGRAVWTRECARLDQLSCWSSRMARGPFRTRSGGASAGFARRLGRQGLALPLPPNRFRMWRVDQEGRTSPGRRFQTAHDNCSINNPSFLVRPTVRIAQFLKVSLDVVQIVPSVLENEGAVDVAQLTAQLTGNAGPEGTGRDDCMFR
jgi:hypothetical protein